MTSAFHTAQSYSVLLGEWERDRSRLQEAELRVWTLGRKADGYANDNERLREENGHLINTNRTLGRELHTLRQDLKKKEGEIAYYERRKSVNEGQLLALVREIGCLRSKNEQILSEAESTCKVKAELEETVRALENRIDSFEENIQSSERSVRSRDMIIEKQSEMMKEMRHEASIIKKEMETLKEEDKCMKDFFQALGEDNNRLRAEVSRAEEEICIKDAAIAEQAEMLEDMKVHPDCTTWSVGSCWDGKSGGEQGEVNHDDEAEDEPVLI